MYIMKEQSLDYINQFQMIQQRAKQTFCLLLSLGLVFGLLADW